LQFLDGRFQRPNPLLGFGQLPLLRDQQLDQAGTSKQSPKIRSRLPNPSPLTLLFRRPVAAQGWSQGGEERDPSGLRKAGPSPATGHGPGHTGHPPPRVTVPRPAANDRQRAADRQQPPGILWYTGHGSAHDATARE
jgi:hypothetical protein